MLYYVRKRISIIKLNDYGGRRRKMKKVKEYPDVNNGISYAYAITRQEWEGLKG